MLKEPGATEPKLNFRLRNIGAMAAALAITLALSAHAEAQVSAKPASLAISIEAPSKALAPDDSTSFVVRVRNSGGAVTTAGRIVMAMPGGLRSLDWTCSAHSGSRCAAASGSGPLDASLSGLGANSTLDFVFFAAADAGPPAFIDIAAHASLAGSDRCETGESAPCRAFLRIPTGPNVLLAVDSSKKALSAGQSVQYNIIARTSNPASSADGTILRSPVPNGLINSRWTCRSSVGACAAASGTGPIDQVVGDFSHGDIQFQIDATVAANPPATIVQSAVAVPPYGGSCAGQGTDAGYRSAPCSARKELSTTAHILVSRSEGYRGTPDTVLTRFVFENVGARGDGSRITAPVPANATDISWTCVGEGAQCPQTNGSGPIAQTVASWPASGKLTYDLTSTSPSATTRDVTPLMQVMPAQAASCGAAGTPPPCDAPQPLLLDHSGLRLQQQVDRLGAGPGELVGIVVAIGTDASASEAHDVVLSIPLPQGIDAIVSWACMASSGSATSCPVRSGKGAIRQVFPVLSASSGLKYFLQARVGALPPTTVNVRSTLTAPLAASLGCSQRDGTSQGCVAKSKFSTVPVLALEQSILADILSPGSPIDYVLDVFNLGAKTDAVRVRSLMPAGIGNVSWVCSGLGMDCPANNGSGSVSSTLQKMPAGAGVRYQVAATVGNVNSASASSVLTAIPTSVGRCHKDAMHESSAAPCTDRMDSSYAPMLELTQTAIENQLLRHGVVHHSLTVKNHGAETNGTKLSLPLASGIESSSWTCAGFGGAVCPQDSGSGAINETISTLPFNSSLTYSIQSELDAGAEASIAIAAITTPSESAQCTNGVCANTLTLPVTEVPSAHLQVVVDSSQTVARAGSTGTWTIDIRNLGREIAGPFSLVDSQPAHAINVLSWTCAGIECPAASGTGPIDQLVGSLSIHDSSSGEKSVTAGRIMFTVEGTVPDSIGSTAELAVAIQPSAGDTCAPVNCQARLEVPTEVLASLLVLEIYAEQSVVEPNGTIDYYFSIRHDDESELTNLPVYSVAPAGFVSSSWTCEVEGAGATCPASGSGDINALVNLGAFETVRFHITAQAGNTLPASLDYAAGVTAPAMSTCDPASCEVTSSLPSASLLQLSLTADASVVRPNDTIDYTFSIANVGGSDSDAFYSTSVEPPDFIATSWTCVGVGGGVCGEAAGTGSISGYVDSMPPGGSLTYSILATVASTLAPNIELMTEVYAEGSILLNCNPDNCLTTLSLPSGSALPARMSISKSADRTSLIAGESVRYTINMANIGTEMASSVQLVDDIPAGISSFNWTCSATGDVICEQTTGSGALNQLIPFVAPASSLIYTVDADVANDATGVVTNLAQLSGDNIECEPIACSSASSLPIRAPLPARMSISKTANRTNLLAGGGVRYTVSFANIGETSANSVQLVDDIPEGLSAFSWTCSTAGDVNCAESSGTGPLNQFFSFMAPGSRVVFTVDASVADDASGVVTNLATLSGDNLDCESPGCYARKALAVIVPSELVVTKTVNPASGTPVKTNQPIVWTLLATNDGGATSGTLTMADTLPTGIRDIVIGVEAEVTCSPLQPVAGETLTCKIPAGFQGQRHVTISAVVNAGPGTVISNTVRATTSTGDVTCMDCTVSNAVEASFDIALMNPRSFSAGGIEGTLIDIVNLSEVQVSGASVAVSPASSVRLLSPFSGQCTATVGDDGNVTVVCPQPPSNQSINCVGNTCSIGELSQNMAATLFVALNPNSSATVRVDAVGDFDPSNNTIELPMGGTP